MSALDEVRWDLSHLLDAEQARAGDGEGGDEAAVTALLDESERLAEDFAARYEGKVAELDGPGLMEAMERLAAISELAGRALNYAHLRFAADTEDPEHRRPDADASPSAAPRSRPSCCSSSSSGSRSTTSAPRSCSPPTASTSAATTCGWSAATARTC